MCLLHELCIDKLQLWLKLVGPLTRMNSENSVYFNRAGISIKKRDIFKSIAGEEMWEFCYLKLEGTPLPTGTITIK